MDEPAAEKGKKKQVAKAKPKKTTTKETDSEAALLEKYKVLQKGLDELRNQLREKREEAEEQAGKEAKEEEEEDSDVVIDNPDLEAYQKRDLIEAALPISSNERFLNILHDPEGPRILQLLLNVALNKAVQDEGITFDTNNLTSALPSKIIHFLFSIPYVCKYKTHDPRENYRQAPGTSMDKEIYDWLKGAMMDITNEFYEGFGMPNPFKFNVFFEKLRIVWRWTRSNNSDNRKERRRKRN